MDFIKQDFPLFFNYFFDQKFIFSPPKIIILNVRDKTINNCAPCNLLEKNISTCGL